MSSSIIARMKSTGAAGAAERWSDILLLWFFRPTRCDPPGFVARHPDHHHLRTRRSRLMTHLVGRLDVARHARLEHLARPVDDVLVFARDDVEHFERAVLVIAGVG